MTRIAIRTMGALVGVLSALLVGVHLCAGDGAAAERRSAPQLVFGIYPGGVAGTIGPQGRTRPEDPVLRRRALLALRAPGRPFVVRLYEEFNDAAQADRVPDWLAAQIAAYTKDGFRIELVLRYRPASATGDVAGFASYTRARVRQLGSNRRVTSLQIANEVNVVGAPAAADGAYPDALPALVQGVIAAQDEARRRKAHQLRIGFNWANEPRPAAERFFAALRAAGGRRFARSVDWVGADIYPGTWGPRLGTGDPARATRAAIRAALRLARGRLLPLAQLDNAALHVSETGYPTGGVGRTEKMQRTIMRATLLTLAADRATYGVTDVRWFDLRDADSSNPAFESQYGLLRDDYTPKAAFDAYRTLVRRLG